MENKIRIVFASDWASIRKFAPVIEENPSEVYGDLIEDLANADLRIVNLEIPLCDGSTPIIKSGPALWGKPESIASLKAVPFDVAVCANNHTFDCALPGYAATRKLLKENHIAPVGAGDDITEARDAELTLSMGGDSFVIVRVYAVNKSAVFAGSMDVLATGSTTPFLCENVECKVALNASASALDLYISGAKFAPQMPTTINIQLQALPCAVTDGGVSFFSNDSIVPLVQMFQDYLPMPEFMFSMIEGSVVDGKLNFNAKMTRGTFKYEGDIITE